MSVHAKSIRLRSVGVVLGAAGAAVALAVAACSATEFDPDFMLDGEPAVLQVRACPPDQATANTFRKVVAATYSGQSILIEVVDGTVLQDDGTWGTRLCQNGTDGTLGKRTNEASFLIKQDSTDLSAVVRVESWREANCGEPAVDSSAAAEGGADAAPARKTTPFKTAIVDLSSVTATTCVTIEGTPPDAGSDASDDADAGDVDGSADADAGEDTGADAEATMDAGEDADAQ